MKYCSRCKETKPLSEWYKNAGRSDGLGVYCKICEKFTKKYADPEKRKATVRRNQRKRRETLIDDLGGGCTCCGEAIYEFLQIDHIQDNGAERRREFNRPSLNTSDLRKHMEELQVLCGSCHNAKSQYGKCPHQFRLVDML